MKKTFSLILILITALTSCVQGNKGDFERGRTDKSPIIKKVKPFVIFDQNDTLFVSDENEVYNINKVGDDTYFYCLFESYEEETDFGKKTLIVRNSKNELLWNLVLEDYTQLAYNKSFILVAYYEQNLLKFFNLKDGKLVNSSLLEQNISDGNEILMTEDRTYIKLINNEDGTTKDVLVIDKNFKKRLLNLNLGNGYYNLEREGNRVFLRNLKDKVYLN